MNVIGNNGEPLVFAEGFGNELNAASNSKEHRRVRPNITSDASCHKPLGVAVQLGTGVHGDVPAFDRHAHTQALA